jgi:hypothetical protein
MTRFRITTVMLGLLTGCLTPSVRAGDWDRDPHSIVNQPPRIQDTRLAPGQYVLQSIEPGVVVNYDADGLRLRETTMGWLVHRGHADENMSTMPQAQEEQSATLKTATGDLAMRRYVGGALGVLIFAFVKMLTSDSRT